jgi:structure-specific endonuclease subunit SLX1
VTGWFVYVLRSNRMSRSYVGVTSDPARRLRQHNGDVRGGARATRGGRPWVVAVLHGPFATRGEALRVEWAVKRRRGLAARIAFRPDPPTMAAPDAPPG